MEKQYYIDVVASMADRTIRRLWIVIILLVVLLFGSNTAWIFYESQFAEEVITQEVLQEVNGENSRNIFAGGDLYGGETESQNDN